MRRAAAKLTLSTGGGWTLAGTLVLAGVVSHWMLSTPGLRADRGSDGPFPGARARETLARLMGDGSPHPVGSAANAAVRDRIVDALESAGLPVRLQSRFVCSSFRRYCGMVHNVLARIDGATPDAILLNSHYDTQPATPGAADPMSGVAVLVEIARMLAAAPRPERSVIFLFNDGEEAGLLGSTAFVEHHPWAADVRAVVNLDARGSAGPSFPAYTIGDDRAVLEPFVSGGRVAAGSVLPAISRLLPNTNDLAVFQRLDVPGALFGFARHIRHYHTTRDDLDHLDAGSLQQQGDQTLAVARAFAGGSVPGGGRLAFVPLGPLVLRWPEAANAGIATSVGVAFVMVLFVLLRRGTVPGRALLWGGLAWPVALVITFFGCAVVNYLRKAATPLPLVWVSHPEPTVLGFAAAAAAWLFACALAVRRRSGPWGFWAGTWSGWAILTLAVGWLAPSFGYLFAVPLATATIASLPLLHPRASGRLALAALALPALISLVVWIPHLRVVLDLVGLGNMPPVASLLALALTPAAPLLLAARRPWAWPAALAVLAAVLLGIGARSPAFSTDHPQWGNLLCVVDAGEGSGTWVYTGSPVPESLQEAGFGDEYVDPLPWSSLEAGAGFPAPFPDLPPPRIEPIDDRIDADGRRILRARAISPRGAPVLQLAFEEDSIPEVVRIADVEVPPDETGRPLFRPGYDVLTIWTMPPEGVDLEIVFAGPGPRRLWVADRSFDLPPGGDALLSARPGIAVPVAAGDGTVIAHRLTI